jgi:hypothetical protein
VLAGVLQLVRVRRRFGHNEIIRRGHAVWQVSQSAAASLLTGPFAPLIMVAGEPLRRYVLARPAARPSRPGWNRTLRRSRPGTQAAMISHGPAGTVQVFWRRPRFWLLVVGNPVWIALAAPARRLLDLASGFGTRGWRGPPAARMREPRRPKPGLPGGSVALAEPRASRSLRACLARPCADRTAETIAKSYGSSAVEAADAAAVVGATSGQADRTARRSGPQYGCERRMDNAPMPPGRTS